MEETLAIEKEFKLLFSRNYRQLCSYAYTFLKDIDSSEDVVQEIFIKIWEKQKMAIGTTQLKYYLFSAVRNNCLTRIQKDKRNFLQELNDEDAAEEIKLALESNEPISNTRDLIAKAMNLLPPKCREVFLLSRLSGQTYLQIADSLGISVKTVENQMGKAIKLLKIFAKEHNIYSIMLCLIYFGSYFLENIGVFH